MEKENGIRPKGFSKENSMMANLSVELSNTKITQFIQATCVMAKNMAKIVNTLSQMAIDSQENINLINFMKVSIQKKEAFSIKALFIRTKSQVKENF